MLNKPSFFQVDDNGITSDPVAGPISLNTLQSYISDVDCPDIAWSFASDLMIIFCKATACPYSDTTRRW